MHRLGWVALLLVAGVGLWLLLGSGRMFGTEFDLGAYGAGLLVLATAAALYTVSRMPRGEVDGAVSPSEWQAWIGLCVNLVGVLYFVLNLPLLAEGPGLAAREVGVNLLGLLLAWWALSALLNSRWKGRVLADERDSQIEARARNWNLCAVVVGLLGLAVMFAASPSDRLQWASHFLIGCLLVFVLVCGWMVEHAGMAWMYWSDRRSQRA